MLLRRVMQLGVDLDLDLYPSGIVNLMKIAHRRLPREES